MATLAAKPNSNNKVIFVRALCFALFFASSASLFRRKAELEELVDILHQKQGNETLRQARQRFVPRTITDNNNGIPTRRAAEEHIDDISDHEKDLAVVANGSSTSPETPPLAGGVVVFYHVYKTGGTTIRENFAALNNVQMKNVRKARGFGSHASQIEAILKGETSLEHNQTYFLEMHIDYPAPKYPTLVQLAPYLKRWKALSEESNVPFFSFVLVRDPIDYAISYFNFFYGQRMKWRWSPYPPLNTTEENLVNTFVPNRQTLIMGADPAGVPTRNATREDLDQVKDTLCSVFDWVGTMEKMQTETLPLLAYLVTLDAHVGTGMTALNVKAKNSKLKRSELSTETLQRMDDGSQLDMEMYNAVVERFPIQKMQERFGFMPQSNPPLALSTMKETQQT